MGILEDMGIITDSVDYFNNKIDCKESIIINDISTEQSRLAYETQNYKHFINGYWYLWNNYIGKLEKWDSNGNVVTSITPSGYSNNFRLMYVLDNHVYCGLSNKIIKYNLDLEEVLSVSDSIGSRANYKYLEDSVYCTSGKYLFKYDANANQTVVYTASGNISDYDVYNGMLYIYDTTTFYIRKIRLSDLTQLKFKILSNDADGLVNIFVNEDETLILLYKRPNTTIGNITKYDNDFNVISSNFIGNPSNFILFNFNRNGCWIYGRENSSSFNLYKVNINNIITFKKAINAAVGYEPTIRAISGSRLELNITYNSKLYKVLVK